MKTLAVLGMFSLSFSVFANQPNLEQTHQQQSSSCGNNKQAMELAQLIMQDAGQQRTSITCDPLLTKLATDKAKLMQERGLVVHSLGGSPNSRLREGNYPLPSYYGSNFDSNQVEAIAGGYESAKEVWRAFKSSHSHRTHLLGEHEFYQEQDEIGVAFIREWRSPHVEYWVVYLTKRAETESKVTFEKDEVPNKGLNVMQKDE